MKFLKRLFGKKEESLFKTHTSGKCCVCGKRIRKQVRTDMTGTWGTAGTIEVPYTCQDCGAITCLECGTEAAKMHAPDKSIICPECKSISVMPPPLW